VSQLLAEIPTRQSDCNLDREIGSPNSLGDAWIATVIEVCEQAAKGNFEPRVLHCDEHTAAGRLGIAINDLLDRADAFVREAAATLEHAGQDKFYRRVLPNGMVGAYRHAADNINTATDAMAAKSRALADLESRRRAMADDLEANVGMIVATLTESAASLRTNAQQLATLSQDTMQAAAEGHEAAGNAAEHVRHVDVVGNSLCESEHVVGKRVNQSREVASGAVQEAARTAELMRQLGAANERIGDVVTLISEIARQTNLLSLNASIEAARAGEAGRGFAVVAREVLKLAEGTASATKRIAKEIAAVQAASSDTAAAIGVIEGTIRQMNDLAGEIDSAVCEQLTVTTDIQQRLRETNDCVERATCSISQAGEAANRTNHTAEQLLVSADQVSQQTITLSDAVKNFLAHVRGGAAAK
jgi:methyl-accepting chemotaxis protein